MKLDLWRFDEKTLRRTTKELPNSILKEQAELLAEKTDGIIYGRITNMKFQPQDREIIYNLATVFEVVVPLLDNYSYTLLTIYSRPERDYPVAITVGSNLIDDAENFMPLYECQDKEAFIQALKTVLSSEEVNSNISILYSKANF
ncbi:MAG: hypothetical protein HFI60_05530 [Lachnospiraceae bacterium]|jgi:hypothetical protein|nr:hypothetical protein [Lachnospiraceae bacterium]MCI8985396.1 hypothetical protein [Lachnospiraceae bacterium]